MSEYDRDREDHRQNVGEWFSRNFVWRIPVYQRHYAWEKDTKTESGPIDLFWETVEQQTIKRLGGETPPPHYLGSVLVEDKTKNKTEGFFQYDVVDGQQRLTTIQIALLSLVRAMYEYDWGDDEWRKGIKEELEKYVFSDKEAKNPKPRLYPTNFDKQQFMKILYDSCDVVPDVGGGKPSRENADKSKIVSAYEFFRKKYSELVNKNLSRSQETVEAIVKTLTKGFDIVLIVLCEEDEAQKIFESLNNFGKPLTTFDLIRNNVFYRAGEKGEDEELFNNSPWPMLEKPYWEEKADKGKSTGNTHIEAYVSRMLVAKEGTFFNLNNTFKIYKEFIKKFSSINDEINSLVEYVEIYRSLDSSMDPPVFPENYFGVFYYEIWKNRNFYPVIFSIESSKTSVDEKRKMLRLLESYVIRRSVCGLADGLYNKGAANICKELGGKFTYEGMHKMFKGFTADTTVFPDDERVKDDSVNTTFYKSPFQRYIFENIEESMRDDKDEFELKKGILTIDHILPQKWIGSKGWKDILLGDDDSRHKIEELTVNSYINTIGNLTLMSQPNNSIKSNRPFDEVKKLLRDSSMKMNREVAEEDTWNVEKISERSRKLADKICELWPYDIE